MPKRYVKLDVPDTLADEYDAEYTIRPEYIHVTANYTVAEHIKIVGVDTSVAVTVTLPTSQAVAGRSVIIKDEKGLAGTNAITVATQGSETIDGSGADDAINTNYGSAGYYSDGANWFKL